MGATNKTLTDRQDQTVDMIGEGNIRIFYLYSSTVDGVGAVSVGITEVARAGEIIEESEHILEIICNPQGICLIKSINFISVSTKRCFRSLGRYLRAFCIT